MILAFKIISIPRSKKKTLIFTSFFFLRNDEVYTMNVNVNTISVKI
jgi:hypothetical protein